MRALHEKVTMLEVLNQKLDAEVSHLRKDNLKYQQLLED